MPKSAVAMIALVISRDRVKAVRLFVKVDLLWSMINDRLKLLHFYSIKFNSLTQAITLAHWGFGVF